ncbi:MAG: phosphate ABC transporter permease subunit PstC [Alphaproteobacteria bacterium]|nr:phosphate ABC transporter permease subunit PstC [Alphaproteobacteria bacterium]
MTAFFTSFTGSLLWLILISAGIYFLSLRRLSGQIQTSQSKPHSLAYYYGRYAVIWAFFPAIIVLIVWTSFTRPLENQFIIQSLSAAYPDLPSSFVDLKIAQIKNISSGLIAAEDDIMRGLADQYGYASDRLSMLRYVTVILVSLIGGMFAISRIKPHFKARVVFEGFLRRVFTFAAIVAILTTIGIIVSLTFEAFRFFTQYHPIDFFFGTHWSPNVALREGVENALDEDVGGSSGSFGMIPVMAGTLLIAFIAMLVAVPIGLFAAIYMAEFASRRVRNYVKPTLEVLAGIPTVVYGFFAALTIGPFIRNLGLFAGLDVSSQSALAAGAVMGIMIIPFISSLSDDVITAVPRSLRDGALGLGSTRGEMITKVVLPAAFPGLVGAFLLAISRAIGETMIVVMAAGVSAQLTANPLDSVTTVTVQIVMLLTGDTEFDSVKTLSAFALGITLFVVTLCLNIAALSMSRRIGGRYE